MNTPLAYSIVPIAPSNSTSDSGSVRRASAGVVIEVSGGTTNECRSDACALCSAHGVVLGLRVVHDDRRGTLLGHQLERARELHAERFLGGKDLEQRCVALEIRARTVAPRIALAAPARDAELTADPPVHPLGDRFGRLDRETMRVQPFAVFTRRLHGFEPARGLV